MDQDAFLIRCKRDRSLCAERLEACANGLLRVGTAADGDATGSYMAYLRASIAELDAVIAAVEAECAGVGAAPVERRDRAHGRRSETLAAPDQRHFPRRGPPLRSAAPTAQQTR